MGVRNVEKFPPQSTALIHCLVPLLGTVGNAEYGNTCAFEVFQSLNGIVDGYLRQKAGASIENMNLFLFKYFNL